jgi:hypothetical protein
MGWIIFFISSIIVFFLCTPFKKWKYFWLAGIISMIMIYVIDSTLIVLGAFSYSYPNPLIGNLPTLYLLSAFFGGTVLVYYYPQRKILKYPYIILAAFLFVCLELLMNYFGYFSYQNWTPVNSFILDIFGFVNVIYLWNWINETKVKVN